MLAFPVAAGVSPAISSHVTHHFCNFLLLFSDVFVSASDRQNSEMYLEKATPCDWPAVGRFVFLAYKGSNCLMPIGLDCSRIGANVLGSAGNGVSNLSPSKKSCAKAIEENFELICSFIF